MRPSTLVRKRTVTAGRLSETIPSGVAGPGASPLLSVIAGMETNHVALIDQLFNLLLDRFTPLSPPVFNLVPTHVLTDDTETAALVIPVTATGGQTHAPLTSGGYHLDFSIDRARFRAETPDNMSNYRATASIVTEW